MNFMATLLLNGVLYRVTFVKEFVALRFESSEGIERTHTGATNKRYYPEIQIRQFQKKRTNDE
jgi:hypothetical protein